ncbi:MAG: RagB/SusD family nutrient uptake outer membrane protein [Bacteroidota bacterium]
MKTYIDKTAYKYFVLCFSWFLALGCTSDLDDIDTNNINANNAFQTNEDYLAFLGKLYGGLSLTGQQGPAGQGDLIGFDEGASNYARNYWNLNEFTADALKWRFSDSGFRELHENTWTPDNDVISAMYNRIIFQVTQANEFIRQVQGLDDAEIATFRAEGRFLRALSYYHGLELFGGNIPFVTEEDLPGAFLPEQTNGADLFAYIESELLAIENELLDPGQPQFYGRADRGAAWTLLAKLYLNAEAFIGQNRYADCVSVCENILGAGYQLDPEYGALFRADNNLAEGIIFPIPHDGVETQSFGLGFILTNGSVSSDLSADLGLTGNAQAFAAISCREEFTRLYEYPNDDPFDDSPDSRAAFLYKIGHSIEVPVPPVGSAFTDGFAYTKFRNMLTDGSSGQDDRQADMDFPLFRLADVYLMYAEAVLRGGGGSEALALDLVNQVRQRAYGDSSGDVTTIDLQFILDERGRELSWEGQRRTDLVRFGQYTGSNYLWDWKGGAPQGSSIENFRNIFPLPASDLTANPNLEQNPGY